MNYAQIFNLLLIVQYIVVAILYAIYADYPRMGYFLSAAAITCCVLLMK